MRHNKGYRHLSRNTNQRKALLRGLAISLFEHGRITTTVAKAKELRRVAERLITIAKRQNAFAHRLALRGNTAALSRLRAPATRLLTCRFEAARNAIARYDCINRFAGDDVKTMPGNAQQAV